MSETAAVTKTWTFYWLDGSRDVMDGNSPSDALNQAGYGHGAVRALDFYAEGENDRYVWNAAKRQWNKKKRRAQAA